jgi:hypothetical protein
MSVDGPIAGVAGGLVVHRGAEQTGVFKNDEQRISGAGDHLGSEPATNVRLRT